MYVKSCTSTQHAYMKLLLVVAILICTNGVVANSTSEPVEHRQLVGFLTPSSVDAVLFLNKWKNAFRRQERKRILAEKKKNAVSDDHEDLVEVQAKIIAANNGRLPLQEEATKVLEVLKSNNLFDVVMVKIIYRGKLDGHAIVRLLAEKVESQLLQQWKADDKSLGLQFKELKLNEMKTEMELYANPAFTTWMKFAFHLQRKNDPMVPAGHSPDHGEQIDAFRSMLKVLKDEIKDSKKKSFKHLLKVLAGTKEEEELFIKWSYVYNQQSSWHGVINNA